jgi:hypothetical protein
VTCRSQLNYIFLGMHDVQFCPSALRGALYRTCFPQSRRRSGVIGCHALSWIHPLGSQGTDQRPQCKPVCRDASVNSWRSRSRIAKCFFARYCYQCSIGVHGRQQADVGGTNVKWAEASNFILQLMRGRVARRHPINHLRESRHPLGRAVCDTSRVSLQIFPVEIDQSLPTHIDKMVGGIWRSHVCFEGKAP